jgi:hypothetical protein
MTQEHIRTPGLDVLRLARGAAEMVRLLRKFETGSGDYTKERGEQPESALEQVMERSKATQEKGSE